MFGTLVDWRSGVAREAERILRRSATRSTGSPLPMPGAINTSPAWRRCARAASRSASSTCCIGAIWSASCRGSDLAGLAEDAARSSTLRGIASTPGRTCRAGLARLKHRFLLAPVSNGNISLMVDLARRNEFPWDAILGAETAGDYKPKPRVYLAACEAFDLAPGDCMMVAAHTSDLVAAAACGLLTAHVARPHEKGPGGGEAAPNARVDVAAGSLQDLAVKLGA